MVGKEGQRKREQRKEQMAASSSMKVRVGRSCTLAVLHTPFTSPCTRDTCKEAHTGQFTARGVGGGESSLTTPRMVLMTPRGGAADPGNHFCNAKDVILSETGKALVVAVTCFKSEALMARMTAGDFLLFSRTESSARQRTRCSASHIFTRLRTVGCVLLRRITGRLFFKLDFFCCL